jgi:hypothetical protein
MLRVRYVAVNVDGLSATVAKLIGQLLAGTVLNVCEHNGCSLLNKSASYGCANA